MQIFFSPSNKGFYNTTNHASLFVAGVPTAHIADAVEVTQFLYDNLLEERELGKEVIMGGSGLPIAVERTTPTVELWTHVRHKRDALLRASDWSQLSDATGDSAAWLTYRALLRDIPQTYAADPETVVWPTPPA